MMEAVTDYERGRTDLAKEIARALREKVDLPGWDDGAYLPVLLEEVIAIVQRIAGTPTSHRSRK